ILFERVCMRFAGILLLFTVFCSTGYADDVLIFGPEKFKRNSGKPITEVRKFNVSKLNEYESFELRLSNGSDLDHFVTDCKKEKNALKRLACNLKNLIVKVVDTVLDKKLAVTSATVKLNGNKIIKLNDFKKKAESIVKPIQLVAKN